MVCDKNIYSRAFGWNVLSSQFDPRCHLTHILWVVVSHRVCVLSANSGPLRVQQMLLATEPSLQLLIFVIR